MSYVIQSASRGVGAIAAHDVPRRPQALGLVVGGKPIAPKPGLITPVLPSAPPPTRTTSPVVLTATPVHVPPVVAGSATATVAPTKVQIRPGTTTTKTCDTGYFYSTKKSACMPNCPPGYSLDSGDNCMPIVAISTPAVPAPSPAPATPVVPVSAPASSASSAPSSVVQTTAPISSSSGGISTASPSNPPPESLDPSLFAPAPAPARQGLTTGQVLLIGGIGLGALYLLFRNKE